MSNNTAKQYDFVVVDSENTPISLDNHEIIAKDNQLILATDLSSGDFVLLTGKQKKDCFSVSSSFSSQIPVEAYLAYYSSKEQADLKSFCNFLDNKGIDPYNRVIKTDWYKRGIHE